VYHDVSQVKAGHAARASRSNRLLFAAMSVSDLHRGFRTSYLDHAQLTAQLHAWAEAYPALVRVTSLGATPEGRE